jgi:hypothetical protein
MVIKGALTILIILLLFYTGLSGQNIPVKKYSATRISIAPVINGTLDDKAWDEGTWAGDFIQSQPYEGSVPRQKTEFKILFDDENIYAAIKAYDTAPDSIDSRMTRRDENQGDLVAFLIDSYHDHRTAFAFGVTAAGVKMDQLQSHSSNGLNYDLTWDPIWVVKTKIFSWGWAAEIKIPLTQVRFDSKSGGSWGLQVHRFIYRYQERDQWQMVAVNSFNPISLFGEAEGLINMKSKNQFDLTPYLVGSYDSYEAEPGNPFADGRDPGGRVGVDGKIGITNDMILDFTINPDFGQVEADPSVVNLTGFETFYEEKRPFFIEGKRITDLNISLGDDEYGNDNLFYSRRIGRHPQLNPDLDNNEYSDTPGFTKILGAFKLTGKTRDGLSVGFISAVTDRETSVIDSSGLRTRQVAEPLSSYFAGRIQKDFKEGNTVIGGMYTNTLRFPEGSDIDFLHKTANTAALDFTQYFKDKSWIFSTIVSLSNVNGSPKALLATQESSVHLFQRPDAGYVKIDSNRTSLGGHGGIINFGKIGGNWNFGIYGLWKSPGLELNDAGYLRAADEIMNVTWASYKLYVPFSIFRYINFGINEWNTWDFGGNYLLSGGNIFSTGQFKNFWDFRIIFDASTKEISNTALRGGPAIKLPGNFNFIYRISTDSRKKLIFTLDGTHTKGFDQYYSGTSLNLAATCRPVNSLEISVTPNISLIRKDLQYVTCVALNSEQKYVLAAIDNKILGISLRVNFNLTPDLTIQYWGQPFIASGKYKKFKKVTEPKAENYSDRFHVFSSSEITYDNSTNMMIVNEDGTGPADYSFSNPDFNANEFLSNLVLRWEYIPGSTLYLAWSQTRNFYNTDGYFNISRNFHELFSENRPYNVFLIKFSYRFAVN